MPTYTVRLYEFDPLGVINSTVGGNTTYSGPATANGTAVITDNQTGIDGQVLDDVAGEAATATTVIGGTSAGSSSVYAAESWTLLDTVTGKTFQVITFRVSSGANTGYYTLSEVPLVVGRTYQTQSYDTTPEASSGDAVFTYADYAEEDGIVSGTGGNDTIDSSYNGDPANEGVDSFGAANVASEFNWSDYADEQDLRGGVTQDTGEVDVQVTYSDVQTNEEFSAELSGGANAIYVASGETFSTTSAGYLFANGSPNNSTITFDFSTSSGSTFKDEVENVRFRISDIDGLSSGSNDFQDIVTVRAFDADGVEVGVTITGGSNHTVSGNTITAGLTNYSPSSAQASALIEIAGPVGSIVVTYDNGGTTQQAIYFSDIQFDAVPANDDSIEAGAGNDLVNAGEGDDTLWGGTGNDTLYGDGGQNEVYGEEGDDTLYAGDGDTVSGGDGDDTFLIDGTQLNGGTITLIGGEADETGGDVLDFNGQLQVGSVTITDPDDANGGKTGTATLLDGTTVSFSQMESIICFAEGSLIETPYGARPIESLTPGDLILTRDHGPQPLRWIGNRTVEGRGRFAPVEFARGSFGNAQPLRVSPQHRMLIEDYRAVMYFGEEEVITAADFLVNGKTITRREAVSVCYYHLLFDQHELVLSSGIWSESYQPGSYSLPGLNDRARDSLFKILPALRSDPNGYGQSARTSLKRAQGSLLAA
ncbi:MAG: hypothetical protein HKN30_02275 [Sulfitobacter sp.]|nr:hypothetical protein [Sulfitobacter sp.]